MGSSRRLNGTCRPDQTWCGLLPSGQLRVEGVAQAIADNPGAVADFLGGKETAAKFLVGQVMKATRGKANPGIVAGLVAEQLGALKQ